MMRDRKASEWSARMRGPDADKHSAAFEEWLRDPRNAAAYADYEADWRYTDDLRRADIPVADNERGTTRQFPLRWAMAVAAVFALAFAWYLQASPRMAGPGAETMSAARVLADGSTVALMDGARIEARFTSAERLIVLRGGRARFTVAHDAGRPFTVAAGTSLTTALGTVFEIDLRTGHPRVHVIDGAVAVRASGSTDVVRLEPGGSAEVADGRAHRIAAARATPPAPLPPDAGHRAAAELIEADDLALRAVLARANSLNPTPIRLADPALGALRVTGRFDLSGSATLARKLAAALDLDLASGPGGHVLRSKAKKSGG